MLSEVDLSNLSRPIHPNPEFVMKALIEADLLRVYRDRPAYQQNETIGWINHAKRMETKQRRLEQMLDELRRGYVHMKMNYKPRKPRR